ncbi:hypothetical protein BDZ45DRAFT_691397 [Acephala macrosclerotiorum]|nr:hypothetical protein BDZ45DRAFT_691397 [Acephala macrosclerotiorum]
MEFKSTMEVRAAPQPVRDIKDFEDLWFENSAKVVQREALPRMAQHLSAGQCFLFVEDELNIIFPLRSSSPITLHASFAYDAPYSDDFGTGVGSNEKTGLCSVPISAQEIGPKLARNLSNLDAQLFLPLKKAKEGAFAQATIPANEMNSMLQDINRAALDRTKIIVRLSMHSEN